MSLGSRKTLKVDFSKMRYIHVNAKQFDKDSRELLIECYDDGVFVKINDGYDYAYLRYKRPDGKCIFYACEITREGKVLVKLQEEMLDVAGKCWADIVIISAEQPNLLGSTGIFVVGGMNTETNELLFYPMPMIESGGYGNLKITSVSLDGRTIELNSNPSPFVTDDTQGNVVMATIMENGKIAIAEAGIISTMPFCVNVIRSAYFEENTGFIV